MFNLINGFNKVVKFFNLANNEAPPVNMLKHKHARLNKKSPVLKFPFSSMSRNVLSKYFSIFPLEFPEWLLEYIDNPEMDCIR